LAALTIIFLLATVTLLPFSEYAVSSSGQGTTVPLTVLVALLVCLIPTTIGGLLSAIGIAGMDRLIQANVIATSGRAVEAAGDVDVLLLDKTGTITLGNRQATEFLAGARGVEAELANAARLASLMDETPEGRSIVALAMELHGGSAGRRGAGSQLRPVHRADAHERRGHRRTVHSQGRDRRHRAPRRRAGRELPEAGASAGRRRRQAGGHAAGGGRGNARAGRGASSRTS
jgi:high-affinity K+ transport system ATPase subunit B